jgi:hypothetical protein
MLHNGPMWTHSMQVGIQEAQYPHPRMDSWWYLFKDRFESKLNILSKEILRDICRGQ